MIDDVAQSSKRQWGFCGDTCPAKLGANGGAKAGGWTWAWDAAPVARHVLEIGPVAVGTQWTTGMFAPDKDGFIHPDGAQAGGHAYVIKGVHMKKGVLGPPARACFT